MICRTATRLCRCVICCQPITDHAVEGELLVAYHYCIAPHKPRHLQSQLACQQAHDVIAASVAHQATRLHRLVVVLRLLQVDDGQLARLLLGAILVYTGGLEGQVTGRRYLQAGAEADG